MLNKKVLVKGITSLSEARYCAGMFVDYISFDLNPESPYYLPKKEIDEIRGWLSGVKILVSDEQADLARIVSIVEEYAADGFLFAQEQFHMVPLVNTEIKVLEWNDSPHSLPFVPEAEVILLLTNTLVDELASASHLPPVVLLGYAFENASNIPPGISGLAFLGSFEQQVGISAHQPLMEALEYIEDHY